MAKNENKIGGLWLSTSQNPKAPFAKGEIEVDGKKIRIVVWRAKEKKNEKSPDYTINIDEWTPGQNAHVAYPVRQVINTFAPPAVDKFDDDIPF
mgnify:CR=1 FL=1